MIASTAEVTEAVGKGVRSFEGAEGNVSLDDLNACDGIIFGSPT
ncbi:hypothetical protein [Sphingomonas kyeonggiensis]|jgi:multimeric flavodoxin WrbA|uniref:Multimeric flavodoxin WrbA n=1 Tax=Sphingomonas kyeonggiensis TaxID=1268553 RepID=A0A7W6NZF2_9SPHN|nr:hypothetical protein [Sphingomonas kyeonggiensis]MBB4100761.1 multimeric flavodoxin WrbA [Sphingomonas kyeonggiensis]